MDVFYRNPDRDAQGSWCYTNINGEITKEHCYIPVCTGKLQDDTLIQMFFKHKNGIK